MINRELPVTRPAGRTSVSHIHEATPDTNIQRAAPTPHIRTPPYLGYQVNLAT